MRQDVIDYLVEIGFLPEDPPELYRDKENFRHWLMLCEESGRISYGHHSRSDVAKLCLWSGLGGREDYGFCLADPDLDKVKHILEALGLAGTHTMYSREYVIKGTADD